jgi:hypothetical protein
MDDMPDEMNDGQGEDRLSNSQLESQREYDPEIHGGDGGVSREEWDQLPGWKRGAINKQATRRRDAEQKALRYEGALEQTRREMAELRAKVEQGTNKAPEPEPQGWDAVKTPKLEEYVTRAEQTMHAALLNPDNDELKKQAASIDPSMLSTARRELAKRDAGSAVAEKEKTWGEQKAKEQAQVALQGRLRNDFGDEVFKPQSELMRAAAQEYQSMSDEGALFGDSARIYMAVERAHKRLNGTQRAMNESERARLSIESGVRREASPFNEIEALRAKGDWKSRGQAVEKSLDAALSAIYGNG